MNTPIESIQNRLQLNTHSRHWSKKWVIITVIVLASIVLLGWYYLEYKHSSAPQYESEAIGKRALVTLVSATGNLEPTNSVDVGIEVSGTLKEILVDYNDRVVAGQVMARLDTTKLASSTESAKASLSRYIANAEETKASLIYAKGEWERIQKMITATGGNYPSRQEVDSTKASLAKATALFAASSAQVKQAQDELETTRYNLNKATIVAPISGIVLERKVDVGQTVVASMTTPILFTMAEDLTKMKAILSVDEADIGEVHDHQIVTFNVDAYPEQVFKGEVVRTRLNAQTVNGVVTYEVVVEVQNDNLLLRPGMTVSASIQTDILKDVLCVPNAALRFTPKQDEASLAQSKKNIESKTPHVWVLRDKKPIRVDVKISKTDGTYTAIRSGELKVKDTVLIGMKKL